MFSHVLCGKCGSFQNRGIDGRHSFLVYSIVNGRSVCPDVSHIYRVWGIGIVYFCSGLSTTFHKINGISLTLFLYPQLNFFGAEGETKGIMEVPISYFDPNNGQAQNLEQRCNELLASGVSEITISELGATYTSDPIQITQLMNDVTQYYEKMASHVQSGVKVTATVVVDDEIDISSDELKKGEGRLDSWATFFSIGGFVVCAIALIFGVSLCGEDPAIGGTIIGFSIGSCIQIFLLAGFLRFVAKLSAKVRQLEDRQ